MARKIGTICAAGEKYTGSDGVEKTRWIKCGVLLLTDKGYRVKMEAMPVGGDGWFAVFEEEETTRGASGRPAPEPPKQTSMIDDNSDIPF